MRLLLYDRVTTLVRGREIIGVKSFSLADEWHRGHFGRRAVVPTTMLVEAMVQLLGWSIIHAHDFQLAAIVCLVEGVQIDSPRLRPGFTAEIGGEIRANRGEDSLGSTRLDVGGRRIAAIERVIFRHFRPVDSVALERTFSYCAGITGDGSAVDGECLP